MERKFNTLGGSSLPVIFSVLTLCIFAFLSLSSALAEKRLSDTSAQSVSAYYEADRQAEEIFARLRSGQQIEAVTVSNGHYRYQCSISENQQLFVELHFHGESWEILRWQAVARSPEITATIPVWNGETP